MPRKMLKECNVESSPSQLGLPADGPSQPGLRAGAPSQLGLRADDNLSTLMRMDLWTFVQRTHCTVRTASLGSQLLYELLVFLEGQNSRQFLHSCYFAVSMAQNFRDYWACQQSMVTHELPEIVKKLKLSKTFMSYSKQEYCFTFTTRPKKRTKLMT